MQSREDAYTGNPYEEEEVYAGCYAGQYNPDVDYYDEYVEEQEEEFY